MTPCGICDGSGLDPETELTCTACNGTGVTLASHERHELHYSDKERKRIERTRQAYFKKYPHFDPDS